jgi:hypothetical protein
MSHPAQPSSATYHSSAEILAHPRFAAARTAYVEAVLDLYEGDAFLNRLLVEAGRQVTFNTIVSLHCAHDDGDRATWPTMRRLKAELKAFGLSSERRLDDLVKRLVHFGFLELRPSERDGRVRLLTPTAKMLALDRDWLAANHVPLHVMFPDPGYSQPVGRDPAFQRAHRPIALGFSAHGAKLMAGNPAMMRYLTRDAGAVILIKLVHMTAAGGATEELSYTDLGARFGVSRTHVRSLLEDAEQNGDLVLSGRGGRRVELRPSILQAFDSFVADSMSGHDLIFRLTLSRMAGA